MNILSLFTINWNDYYGGINLYIKPFGNSSINFGGQIDFKNDINFKFFTGLVLETNFGNLNLGIGPKEDSTLGGSEDYLIEGGFSILPSNKISFSPYFYYQGNLRFGFLTNYKL